MSIYDDAGPLLNAYEAAWNAFDFEGLRTLWAEDEAEPWWLPEELEAPLIGWSAIEAYWRDCEALIGRFGIRTWDRRVKRVTGDVAIAVFMMKWTAVLRNSASAPIGGTVKVTVVLRHDHGWRIVHYMEAALGPLPFMRAAYAAAAEPALLRE